MAQLEMNDAVIVIQVLAGKNPAGIRPEYWASGADVTADLKTGPEDLIYILNQMNGHEIGT